MSHNNSIKDSAVRAEHRVESTLKSAEGKAAAELKSVEGRVEAAVRNAEGKAEAGLVKAEHSASAALVKAEGGVAGLWHAYLKQLVVNPVRTKALTSAFCSALAGVLAQRVLGVPLTAINWTAVKNQALLGLIRGPVIHYWMEALTKFFTYLGYKPAQQTATPIVLGKMALDQLVFAPLHLLYYIHATGFLEGRSFEENSIKAANEWWPILVANWKVWPIVSILNFKFVPPQLRVLSLNVCGVVWMVFIISRMAKAAQAAAAAAALVKK